MFFRRKETQKRLRVLKLGRVNMVDGSHVDHRMNMATNGILTCIGVSCVGVPRETVVRWKWRFRACCFEVLLCNKRKEQLFALQVKKNRGQRRATDILTDTAWAHMRGLNKKRKKPQIYLTPRWDTTMGAYAGIEQRKKPQIYWHHDGRICGEWSNTLGLFGNELVLDSRYWPWLWTKLNIYEYRYVRVKAVTLCVKTIKWKVRVFLGACFGR